MFILILQWLKKSLSYSIYCELIVDEQSDERCRKAIGERQRTYIFHSTATNKKQGMPLHYFFYSLTPSFIMHRLQFFKVFFYLLILVRDSWSIYRDQLSSRLTYMTQVLTKKHNSKSNSL